MIEEHIRKKYYAWGDHAICAYMMVQYLPNIALKVWLADPLNPMNETFDALDTLIDSGSTTLLELRQLREQLATEAFDRRMLNKHKYDELLKLIKSEKCDDTQAS